MYELVKVSDNCFFIQSPARIGVIRVADDRVCLVDSGNDKDAGKKIRKILDENGWTLEAIYNTHSHADHCGGNQYLQRQYNCRIYAFGIERDLVEHTILEPSLLYGGNPPKELRHKFLMARESEAMPLTEEVLPDGASLVPLPGHSFDMVGLRTGEGIVYLADCLSGEETLEKYQISFLVDVQAYLDTLDKVRSMEAELFIPAHADPTEDIAPLADLNIQKVHEIGDSLVEICAEPLPFDDILKKVFERYGLAMTFEQHALVGSTIRSYLTWLAEEGRITPGIEDNTLIWRT